MTWGNNILEVYLFISRGHSVEWWVWVGSGDPTMRSQVNTASIRQRKLWKWICGPVTNAEGNLVPVSGLEKRCFTRRGPRSHQEEHSHESCGKGICCRLPTGSAAEIKTLMRNATSCSHWILMALFRPCCECEGESRGQTLAARGCGSAPSGTCSACTHLHLEGRPRSSGSSMSSLQGRGKEKSHLKCKIYRYLNSLIKKKSQTDPKCSRFKLQQELARKLFLY